MFQMSSLVSQVSLSLFLPPSMFAFVDLDPEASVFCLAETYSCVWPVIQLCNWCEKEIIVYLGQKNASHDLTREEKGERKNGPLIYIT